MNLPKQAKPIKRKATATSYTKGVVPSGHCTCSTGYPCIGACVFGECTGFCAA